MPGSPVRAWIGDLTEREPAVAVVAPEAQPPAPAPPAAADRVEAGVSVEAVDGVVEVLVHDARELQVRAMLVEGTRAGVYAAGGAASSRFVTGAGRIEVLRPSAGELRIEVPRGTPDVSVKINDREVLRMHAGRLDMSVGEPELDAAGVEFSVDPP
jgi:hypothetical protein